MKRRTHPKEKKKRTPSPYRRRLHFDGEEWSWQVGKDNIVASNPDGTIRFLWKIWDFFGVTPDEIERARWKGSRMYNVTPKLVKQRIETKLAVDKSIEERNKRFNLAAFRRRYHLR